ncbi:EamA family transporter [Caproiciproducens galactitolivorans]|uniref:Putative DMT superfamily transporter inner membrane protein n=1 Tax=Caproiciproducens galactitolivorans TaxID=642589 RepID=A0A4Z0YB71_9FIRM|nr:DMT family transporter [Caproiciproducens galactitolivorans]QEY34094.1 EamA family transporter [Caproiciproducens galactitolivorans]TGJ76491.1 putative DMT superfamily transporter inner membrane protein [Caproiciproducens galactitolivorans]
MEIKNKAMAADLGLVFITIIWGSGFVVVKNTVDAIPPGYMIAMRFGIAVGLMCLIFFNRLKKLNWNCIKSGIILGLLMFISYYLQTVGIQYTTAGNNAFLTAVYVVVVPFLYWIIRKEKPDAYNIFAALLCIVGIGLLTLRSGFSMNTGDMLSLFCGITFAAQIVAVSILAEKNDPILISFTQFVVTAIFAFAVALFTEPFPEEMDTNAVLSTFYIGICCTLIALVLQTVCQKYTPPARASLIMSLESLFGSIFGIIFLSESLTMKTFFGSILIFLSIMISEMKPSFLKLEKKSLEVPDHSK